MIKIRGNSSILGLIGNPVEHSLSPIFQNYMIAKSGLNYVYIPFKVELEGIKDFMIGLRNIMNLRGLNVTVPFKEIVFENMDFLSGEAEKIGAINTILVENGKFYGYNTDVCGIIYTLKMKLNINDLSDYRIVLFGAGGASKSAIWSIHGMGGKDIYIVNRTVERFEKLSRWAKRVLNLELKFYEWEKLGRIFKMVKPDLIINSTPLGLGDEKIRMDFENSSGKTTIFDMTYGTKENFWGLISKKYRFKYCDGLPMLVAQGVESFKIWTGFNFEVNKILLYLKKRLSIWQRF
ncbi:MAG: shikimate dehydrogenase [Proteobacteria bacterium]|nr:shikimate dehydrogenase [Pseudomonadota bacterium]